MANTGKWGITKGLVRSLFLLPTVREELEILMALNPRSARTLHSYAVTLFELPGLVGGDRKKAEEYWKKTLEIDPHYTVARTEYARLLIATRRDADARRELRRVLDEQRPTNRADWVVRDVPRAKALLESIGDRR
jgi:predicted Zn-dependent protease